MILFNRGESERQRNMNSRKKGAKPDYDKPARFGGRKHGEKTEKKPRTANEPSLMDILTLAHYRAHFFASLVMYLSLSQISDPQDKVSFIDLNSESAPVLLGIFISIVLTSIVDGRNAMGEKQKNMWRGKKESRTFYWGKFVSANVAFGVGLAAASVLENKLVSEPRLSSTLNPAVDSFVNVTGMEKMAEIAKQAPGKFIEIISSIDVAAMADLVAKNKYETIAFVFGGLLTLSVIHQLRNFLKNNTFKRPDLKFWQPK